MTARGSRTRRPSSGPSSRPSPRARGWGWRCPARSPKPTAEASRCETGRRDGGARRGWRSPSQEPDRRVFLTIIAKNCSRCHATVALASTALYNNGVPSVPITTRLSRRLHQTLGDEAANDLVNWMQQVDVQRVEFREWLELKFSGLDARLTEARADLADLRQDLHALDTKTQVGFAQLRQEM